MSAETRTTSSTGGQKGVKLERFDLIPVGPLTALAAHFGRGAAKYDDNQWRKGYEWSKSYAAKQRHDNLFWAGFDYDVCENDPEGCAHVDQHGEPFEGTETEHGHTCYNHTGSHHLDASNWHGFVLREFTMTHPEHDDRYRAPEPEVDYEALFGSLRDVAVADPPSLRPRPSDIFTLPPDGPTFGTRCKCSSMPLFDLDEESVIVGDHTFEPDVVFMVRFVAGADGVTDLRPERTFYEVQWQDPEPMTPAGLEEVTQAINDALNRRD